MKKLTLVVQISAPPPPRGMAAMEYLLASVALSSAWLILYSSPSGLGKALMDLLLAYSFSLSLPW